MKTVLLSSNQRNCNLFLCFFVVMMCLISCKKDVITPSNKEVKGEAKLKIVNASKNSTAIDFYINNFKINEVSLAFGEGSEYLKVESGSKSTSVANNGTEEAIAEMNFTPTFSYTSFYVEDKLGKGELLTFEDNLGATEAGKARIRFINLSPSLTNNINVNLAGSVLLINSLAFKETSAYFSVDENTDLSVSVLGTGVVKLIPANEIIAGKIYTIWFSGTSNGNLAFNKITYN